MSEPPSWRTRAQRWKELSSGNACGRAVGISASFTANALIPQLGVALHDQGQGLSEVLIGEYNQLHQTCMDPVDQFGGQVGVLVLLWRLEDLFPIGVEGLLRGDPSAMGELVADVEELTALAATAAAHSTVVVALPPPIDIAEVDPLDQGVQRLLRRAHRRVVETIETAATSHENRDNIELFDLDLLIGEQGRGPTRDVRLAMLYRQPYSNDFFFDLGTELARTLANLSRSFPKCIAVDCDNTLWGGVIGEDGIEGIVLSDDFPGSAHQALQRQLLRLKNRGVLLAVVSKNDPEAVEEVFENHAGMVLTASDVAAWRVNWLPKSDNIRSLSQELNFGVDSFVFIDDSDFEINEVRAALPGVTALQLPPEPADIPELLVSTGLFRGMRTTEDDRLRTERTHEERARASAGAALTTDQFLHSLELVVRVTPMRPDQLERTTQLINKTNQFNLTTLRRTPDEVAELAAGAGTEVIVVEVSDRFGDYGLVGVVIVAATTTERWEIDTFLLSCRVLGRGVEFALLAAVKESAAGSGALEVLGRYERTPKNDQVSDFYVRGGFSDRGDGSSIWPVVSDTPAPDHVTLVRAPLGGCPDPAA